MLKGKKILLGITGSIAAYKAAILVRCLVKEGAEVKVIMTETAKHFITPLTMATVSKNPILVEFFNPENGEWNSHVSLGEWADLYLIAPATANTIAKMTFGVADNLLLTTYLSARCKVALAPAMDLDMYAHITTQQNLETLRGRGVAIVEPEAGELASGLVGKGRMAEPEHITEQVKALFEGKSERELQGELQSASLGESRGISQGGELAGKHFMVTAGPTVEAIDPVRYITNHSTGKMGYAIAEQLAARGAKVSLISGPTALATPEGVERYDVVSAEDMFLKSQEIFAECSGAVMCAAVADYTPVEQSQVKIKKSDDDMSIALKRTKDIAATLGAVKGGRLLVGFALETDHEQENAMAKLERKGFDFVVLNSLQDSGAGFGHDTNKVRFVSREGIEELPLMSKQSVAQRIVEQIVARLDIQK